MNKKVSYTELSIELDKFFFLPFGPDESPAMRAEALDAYMLSVGWTWDDVFNAIVNQKDTN